VDVLFFNKRLTVGDRNSNIRPNVNNNYQPPLVLPYLYNPTKTKA
jgi:hypothetical protein